MLIHERETMVLLFLKKNSLEDALEVGISTCFIVTQSKFDYERISMLFVKTNRSLLRLL